jgi:hypothetical protein
MNEHEVFIYYPEHIKQVLTTPEFSWAVLFKVNFGTEQYPKVTRSAPQKALE